MMSIRVTFMCSATGKDPCPFYLLLINHSLNHVTGNTHQHGTHVRAVGWSKENSNGEPMLCTITESVLQIKANLQMVYICMLGITSIPK